jgi:poly(3-hydroxybutyrate) depolymerase
MTKPRLFSLNFHGGGGSPEVIRRLPRWMILQIRGGFIVVYPRGTRPDGDSERQYQRFWNVKRGPTGELY